MRKLHHTHYQESAIGYFLYFLPIQLQMTLAPDFLGKILPKQEFITDYEPSTANTSALNILCSSNSTILEVFKRQVQ